MNCNMDLFRAPYSSETPFCFNMGAAWCAIDRRILGASLPVAGWFLPGMALRSRSRVAASR